MNIPYLCINIKHVIMIKLHKDGQKGDSRIAIKQKTAPPANPGNGGFTFDMAGIRDPIRSSIKRSYNYPHPPCPVKKFIWA
jgi:hypothetical protein